MNMEIFIYIIALLIVVIGAVLWISTDLGRWSNEVTDSIFDEQERHDYKNTEAGVE